MKVSFHRLGLKLAHKWTIANRVGPGGGGGTLEFPVTLLELFDPTTGIRAYGEAAPSNRYGGESVDSCLRFFESLDGSQLRFDDLNSSRDYVQKHSPGQNAAKGAVDIALLDGHAQLQQKPVHEIFNLGWKEDHMTSFSIGIDRPEIIRQKVLDAHSYPILKLKVGGEHDLETLRVVKELAPEKTIRLDANEAWVTREIALSQLEAIAQEFNVEFVEQPMPADSTGSDWEWLKARTPIPIMADESYVTAADAEFCAQGFHSVNVKLVKAGGITGAYEALRAARKQGLKTMLGCMIETSVLITAAAHLADLTDTLDLDGNLLITNDPFEGVQCENGRMRFPDHVPNHGLRIRPRS